MVEDRRSPSAGWREVYSEMEADTDVEAPTARCPDCGRRCRNLLRDVYECPDHGVFRPTADDDRERRDAEWSNDRKNRTRGTAD
ncbi:hypothetical protein BRC82_00800 [Halobacteriales archaeon QS_1_67_19]|nr:MAG: hypothetical protein BRC82_00800 [Halobacteriales archaeon QS_1_67_19]